MESLLLFSPSFFVFDTVVKVVDFVVNRGKVVRYKNYDSVYFKLDKKIE